MFHAHIKYNLECIWAQKMELVNKTIGLFVENITHCECIKSNQTESIHLYELIYASSEKMEMESV